MRSQLAACPGTQAPLATAPMRPCRRASHNNRVSAGPAMPLGGRPPKAVSLCLPAFLVWSIEEGDRYLVAVSTPLVSALLARSRPPIFNWLLAIEAIRSGGPVLGRASCSPSTFYSLSISGTELGRASRWALPSAMGWLTCGRNLRCCRMTSAYCGSAAKFLISLGSARRS